MLKCVSQKLQEDEHNHNSNVKTSKIFWSLDTGIWIVEWLCLITQYSKHYWSNNIFSLIKFKCNNYNKKTEWKDVYPTRFACRKRIIDSYTLMWRGWFSKMMNKTKITILFRNNLTFIIMWLCSSYIIPGFHGRGCKFFCLVSIQLNFL